MPRSYPRRAADGPVPLSFERMVQPDRRSDRRPASRLDAEGRRQVAPDVGEPRRAPAARGDGGGRVRRAAVPGRAPADGRRLRRRRLGDGLPDAPQRRRRAALDRGRQGRSARLLERRDAIVARAPACAPAESARPGGARAARHRDQRRDRPPQRRGADRPPAPPPARRSPRSSPASTPSRAGDGSAVRSPGRAIRVRRATASDAPAIRRIAHDGWRATYRGLLLDETIEWFLELAYSEERVDLRIERHETWVALADEAVGLFAETAIEPDRVTLVAIYADPALRGLGLGTAALADDHGGPPGPAGRRGRAGRQRGRRDVLRGARLRAPRADRRAARRGARPRAPLVAGPAARLRAVPAFAKGER